MSQNASIVGAATGTERERVDALVELGIDSPLKLDLVATIEQGSGGRGGTESLAAACGVSQREVGLALESLARSGLLERRHFYNISEYSIRAQDSVLSRVRSLIGETSAELRRVRRALLARSLR